MLVMLHGKQGEHHLALVISFRSVAPPRRGHPPPQNNTNFDYIARVLVLALLQVNEVLLYSTIFKSSLLIFFP